MSIDSELRSAEVLLDIDLTKLRKWWRSPIQDGCSLENLCENQQAARIVTQGLQQAILFRNHRFARNIVIEQLRFAARLPDEPDATPTLSLPFWITFLQQAAQTVSHWTAICDEISAELRAEFVKQAWSCGAVHIAAGFPMAALETWRRLADELTEAHKRAMEEFRAAEGEFARACSLATEFGIAPPAVPAPLTTEAYASAVLSWRNSVLREALDELFWQAQRPGLERIASARGSGKKRSDRVKALLRSCDRKSSPNLLDHESLAEVAYVRIHDCLSTIIEAEERGPCQEPASDSVSSSILCSPRSEPNEVTEALQPTLKRRSARKRARKG